MPAVTPVYAWPYQTLTDPPDGPNLGEDLALAIEATVAALAARVTTLEGKLPLSAIVATSQTTALTSYTDLGTVGPAVTLTTGTSALVIVTATMSNGGGNHDFMSFAVSGATTIAAADAFAYSGAFGSGAPMRASATFRVTGLNAGSNTFTVKYRVGANTGTWADRHIIVIP